MDYLGNAASIFGAAIELKNFIYEPMKREFGYFWHHAVYVENLKDEARKLKDKKAGLQNRVEEDQNNARVVLPEVESWLRDVTDIQAKMDEIETEIANLQNGGFSRPLHRRLVSKRVEEIAEAMKELQKSCGFDIISVPPPQAALVPIQLRSALEFESRKHVEDGIMTSLRDGEVYKVGICGMGGVGKTTMAKRIMHGAREEGLFEEIVMVVVSQNADKARIQEDIATSLGLKFEEKSQPSRAHLLHTRLSNNTKRSLIIVDDIWEDLNLDDLGIPCASHCKVLLTSRNTDVFKKMNVVDVHGVDLLTDAEAWDFFQLNAGNCIGHPNVDSVAQQVVQECKGLPIALKTVGAALKDTEDASIWKDSLKQLRSSNPSDMPDVLDGVYKPLRLSYDFLYNKQIQSLFLMCCLYQEDGNIPIEDLAISALGLGIFEELERLEDIRHRVYSLVKKLESRSLLLEGDSENHVKMHDIIRDVAIFIASGEKLIRTSSKSNDYTWISPYIRETIGLHGGSTDYPNLRLLWIDCSSRDNEGEINELFFEGMKQLHVLSIKSSLARQLPKMMRFLENIQTLVLECCQSLGSISVVSAIVNLKILICRRCGSIESLPMEIGSLSGLKLLELSECEKLETIPPGIISMLKELEELIVWECFDGWKAKNVGKESKNALLSELEHLPCLSHLKIEVKDSRLAAEQIHLSSKLMKYHIRIGDFKKDNNMRSLAKQHEPYERKMELVLRGNISLGEWIHKLVRSVEYIYAEANGSVLDIGVAQNMKMLEFKERSSLMRLVEHNSRLEGSSAEQKVDDVPIEMVMEENYSQLEGEEDEEMSSDDDRYQTKEEEDEEMSSDDDGDQTEKVQNVEERHSNSMVGESKKQHAGPSIGMENEFQSEKWRRIETEESEEIDYLRGEARKLEDNRDGLQMRVDEAENSGRIVLSEVKSWLREVTDIQAKMDEIETEIATIQNGGFSRSLHCGSLTKRVKRIAEAMKELQKSRGFEIISVPPSVVKFESGKHIEDGIMKSLRDDEVYKVGICGMGGVGKITMAKRIMHRARQEHLFEEIVMVVVSQNADMVRIQDDIARSLDLNLGEGSLYVKAHLLRSRLSERIKKCLIVMDDVWQPLKLDDLGIPSCHSGCKMLITSRNRDILNGLNVDKIYAVEALSKVEAWDLFKLNVGSCIDHPNVISVARQVLEECKGLPIALISIGAALKNCKDSRVWNDLLHQLKSSNPIDLPSVPHDVYKPLRLSYKFLEREEAKPLFLLCCLFPEDHNIPLDQLTFYAMGLGILKRINKLEEARNRVCSLVETLKSRFLLLEGYYEDHVRMHDVVRDVAVSIALDEKLITTHSNDGSWISPYIGGGTGLRAGSRAFPNLHLLCIDGRIDRKYNINECFFEGMKELKVLSIECSPVTQLPQRIAVLKNLQTLVLQGCRSLKSILIVGELGDLKILICRECDSIESLPLEIGRLSSLILMEFSDCKNLKTIPPGILSKLKRLEELIVWKCFNRWEANNALLSELPHLPSLSRLKIALRDSRLLLNRSAFHQI